MVKGSWDMRAERLLPDELIPVVSPSLLEKHGPIRKVEDLAKFVLIHNTTRKNAWPDWLSAVGATKVDGKKGRSEEHTSELQSLMRIAYAVFCLKKNIKYNI